MTPEQILAQYANDPYQIAEALHAARASLVDFEKKVSDKDKRIAELESVLRKIDGLLFQHFSLDRIRQTKNIARAALTNGDNKDARY